MPALFLTEDDVRQLIDMPTAVSVVREAFGQWGLGQAMNVPRRRAKAPGILLHSLSAGAEYLGLVGWKNYTTTKTSARFHIALYDAESGEMLVFMEADWLGRFRTGAASGVATDLLSRKNSRTVGLFGTGKQAETQLAAISAVRQLELIQVCGRDRKRLDQFAQRMSEQLNLAVEPVTDANQVAREKDIVVTAATSKKPLFDGESLSPGTHLNLIGSNHLRRTEVDVRTIARADLIVCDSIEQCQLEAGDFTQALEAGIVQFESMRELKQIVAGNEPGRENDADITLFKSVGLGLEDVALGAEVLKRAKEQGLGTSLPF